MNFRYRKKFNQILREKKRNLDHGRYIKFTKNKTGRVHFFFQKIHKKIRIQIAKFFWRIGLSTLQNTKFDQFVTLGSNFVFWLIIKVCLTRFCKKISLFLFGWFFLNFLKKKWTPPYVFYFFRLPVFGRKIFFGVFTLCPILK